MISFNCVQCGKKFLTPEHLAGRKGKCARCGTLYEIPQPGAPMEDATPSAATGEFVAYREPREDSSSGASPSAEASGDRSAKEEPPEPKEMLPWPVEELPWEVKEPPEPEPPKIRFACGECGRKFAMSLNLAGNAGTCPDCETMFLVPTHSDGEAPPPPPPLPPPPPQRSSRPTATMPSAQPSPAPQQTSRPTATLSAVQAPSASSKATATLPAASSLVQVRTDKPYLDTGSAPPPSGGGAKGLVAALVLCSIAAGGAFWAWKTTSSQPAGTTTAGTDVSNPGPTPPAPPPKPVPTPVAYTSPPPEEPVLTPPVEEPPPEYHEDPPPFDPTPPPIDPAQPPTPIDPASTAPPVPDAAQVPTALAEFERQRGYVKDCPDAVQQARALDALACVVGDARAIDVLGKILTTPAELPLVRRRAAEMLGDSRSSEAVPALQAGFDACRAEPEVARAVIVSLGRIDSAASVKALSAVARGWTKAADEERDHMYASVALLSISTSMQHRNEAVDAMLGFWAGLVAAKPADTSDFSEAEWKRESHRTELESSVQTSLCTLTGQAFAEYGEWQAWWGEKRGSLK